MTDATATEVLWQRRVAVLATFGFLDAGDASTTLELAERLLPDRADLMRKAVGWMLREAANGSAARCSPVSSMHTRRRSVAQRSAMRPSTCQPRNGRVTGRCADRLPGLPVHVIRTDASGVSGAPVRSE
ncbi:DNA alkylation repair protein [Mycetocola sp.]|uniref:DNA alkylation repair protein n=1 Tax=Mycetocola sp. TaxID=1871042 RepID=UPI00398997E2